MQRIAYIAHVACVALHGQASKRAVRSIPDAVAPAGRHITMLRGNLAPDSAVTKLGGKKTRCVERASLAHSACAVLASPTASLAHVCR